ncbi:MAG: ATP-binding cassette domain-containing protein, partial [Planctomycetaceae bacterium]|nr:ATP-binding cassette domain-containing protein [Planctomycetaceae bacterium]
MTTVSNQSPALAVDRLTKRYGDFTALDSLTITIECGRILGLIGPNGSGKTTAIKMLVGLARPTEGTAHIAGIACSRDSRKIKRMVGYMPDKFGAYDNMRVTGRVNDEVRQDDTTANIIFDFTFLINYVSTWTSLK